MSLLSSWPNTNQYNLTIDDFAPFLTYTPFAAFGTPDPSQPSFDFGPWNEGTFHNTTQKNATITLEFEGSGIYIFGASTAPFTLELDYRRQIVPGSHSDLFAPHLLYKNVWLPYAKHALTLTDFQGDFLLDYMLATIQIAPLGAKYINTTVEESSPAVKYTGNWTFNSSPVFSGGHTAYSPDNYATASLSFNGTSLEIWGDKTNNHGTYSIALTSTNPRTGHTHLVSNNTYNALSGCGGSRDIHCEKATPSLKYAANSLDQHAVHTVTIQNIWPGDIFTYFDLDFFRIITSVR